MNRQEIEDAREDYYATKEKDERENGWHPPTPTIVPTYTVGAPAGKVITNCEACDKEMLADRHFYGQTCSPECARAQFDYEIAEDRAYEERMTAKMDALSDDE